MPTSLHVPLYGVFHSFRIPGVAPSGRWGNVDRHTIVPDLACFCVPHGVQLVAGSLKCMVWLARTSRTRTTMAATRTWTNIVFTLQFLNSYSI